jgi:hypothetical protein
LIFGNDCRKLGGVVKEGQGWWMTRFFTSQWKALWRHILQVKYCGCSHLVRRQRNAGITHCVTIAAKILLYLCVKHDTKYVYTAGLTWDVPRTDL